MKRSLSRWSGIALVLLLIVWVAASSGAQRRAAEMTDQQDYAAGELLVKFVPGVPPGAADNARQAVGARVVKTFRRIGVEHWRLGHGVSVEKALEILARMAEHRHIEYAEPNYIVHATSVYPIDPGRTELWGLHNVGQTGGTKDADIDAPEAWQVQKGSSVVVVGVIGSGIDYNHPDLAANIWTNPGEIPGNGVDDDGNGYVDDVYGWDFINNDNDPMDDDGDGTHEAGTIGAVGNNGIGVTGVNWHVKLMALKFLGSGGSGHVSNEISAILYAADFGVRITNNSYGGKYKSNAEQDAIASCGALFVAGAGTAPGYVGSSTKVYPAGYALDNIVSVTATDHNDLLASFSNYSATWVDLGAPGVDIYSTRPNNSYGFASGASMATPHVTGAAALVLAQFPGATIAEIKSRILNSVDLIPGLAGKTLTGGRLNAARAIGVNPTPPTDTTPPAAVTDLSTGAVTEESVALSWHATGNDGMAGFAYLYDVRYATTPISEGSWGTATPAQLEPIPQAAGSPESFTVVDLQGGTTYYFAIKVGDEAGNFSPLSNLATTTTVPGGWNIETVDIGGFYQAHAYDPAGNPTVAYGAEGGVKFARKVGGSWEFQTVGSGGAGIAIAYDPTDGYPSVSYDSSRTLLFAHWNGTSWQTQIVERRIQVNDVTSLAYDPNGRPSITYRGRSGLQFARWNGSAWVFQTIPEGSSGRYNSLAYDGNGNPSVAFSADIDGNGYLDSVKFARWNGSSWDVQTVEAGAGGVPVSLAYDPAGNPAIAYGKLRVARWNGSSWDIETVPGDGGGQSLAIDASGNPAFSYNEGSTVKYATRTSTGWLIETVDKKNSGSWITSLRFDPSGRPSVTYHLGNGNTLKFARRLAVP